MSNTLRRLIMTDGSILFFFSWFISLMNIAWFIARVVARFVVFCNFSSLFLDVLLIISR